MDVGTNLNEGLPHNQGVACTETADTVLPNALRARLNYSTGVLEVDVDEIVDVTPASKLSLTSFFLADATGDDYVGLATLGGASIREYDHTTITLILTELQRADAVLKSGVPGGDASALVLDVKANGILDIAQNPNQGIDLDLTVTETADTVYPVIYNATLDLNDGTLIVYASETIDARLVPNVNTGLLVLADATGKTNDELSIRISGATVTTSRIDFFTVTLTEDERVRAIALSGTSGGDTNGCTHTPANNGVLDFTISINSQTISEIQGVAVTQNNGFIITTLSLNGPGQTITESEGETVTQSNGYITWTMQVAAQDMTLNPGIVVTQTSNSGTGQLSVALTGTGMISIVLTSTIGQQFNIAADLVFGPATCTDPDGGTTCNTHTASSTTCTSTDGGTTSRRDGSATCVDPDGGTTCNAFTADATTCTSTDGGTTSRRDG
jgi:hypothetical protein